MAFLEVSHSVTAHERRRVALIAMVSASIEWYDFFLYGIAAALVFSTVFFPPELTPLAGLLAAFGTFAVGFIARPLGGVIFGHFGDKRGRKTALVASLVLMGGATSLIGLLPSFQSVGYLAPVLLVVLRFAQGLAIGGQWGGAVLLAIESAPPGRRGFYGSFAQVGAPIGVVLANVAVLLVSGSMTDESFVSWGWRIPFLASILLIAVAIYVQLRLQESPAFKQAMAVASESGAKAQVAENPVPTRSAAPRPSRSESPVLQVIRSHPKTILLAAGSFMAVQVTFYILIAFVIAYGANPAILNLPRELMLTAVLIGAAVMIPAILASAMLSDLYGRKRIFLAGAILLGLWSFALFPLIDTGSLLWITVGIAVGQVFNAMMYGPQAAFFAELFGTKVRYSGASLGYQLGAIFGGALAPLIATSLLATFGGTLWISVYMAMACLVTIASIQFLRETYRDDMAAH